MRAAATAPAPTLRSLVVTSVPFLFDEILCLPRDEILCHPRDEILYFPCKAQLLYPGAVGHLVDSVVPHVRIRPDVRGPSIRHRQGTRCGVI